MGELTSRNTSISLRKCYVRMGLILYTLEQGKLRTGQKKMSSYDHVAQEPHVTLLN